MARTGPTIGIVPASTPRPDRRPGPRADDRTGREAFLGHRFARTFGHHFSLFVAGHHADGLIGETSALQFEDRFFGRGPGLKDGHDGIAFG